MSAFADDQAAVFGTAGIEVDEALEAAETRFGWVLVLVRPGFAVDGRVLGQYVAKVAGKLER